ncbi:MAG TPA: aminoglycoside phosphotransferase family protein [Gaiellaceae bacterium]|nr:aminoglycoside phosphotransferase family protein [Gaiellaceae bacterium]
MEVDLSGTRAAAEAAARAFGVELGAPFALSRHSFVAPAGDGAVLKVAWEGDDESLHEPEALELWSGDGAVRLIRREGRALLLDRARPGTDISGLGQEAALDVAVELGRRLWRPAQAPFRPVDEHVPRWLANAPTPLTPLALELWESLRPGRDFVVHGDFHHHNVLRHGDGFVAIDPKPYLADREYDVYPWLHNPLPYRMTRADAERRIERFVGAGLDESRIRAWCVIRGAYLTNDPAEQAVLRSLAGS